MKRTLSTLLILTAILLVGCDRKGSSSLAKPPIAIDVIAPAVADQMAGKLAERFVRVGEVRFDESANVYHVEVFYLLDEQEKKEVLEFSRHVYPDRPNLLVYGAKCNTNTEFIGKDVIRAAQGFYITIDTMMGAIDTNSSGVLPDYTYTLRPNGSTSMTYLRAKLEIKTEDYELTVNGELYGRISDGDVVMVKNGKVYIMVKDGKVYRNGVEIFCDC